MKDKGRCKKLHSFPSSTNKQVTNKTIIKRENQQTDCYWTYLPKSKFHQQRPEIYLPYMRSVQKVSQILNFRGYVYSNFDFFVALCWYSHPSIMPTSSVILNVQLIFDSYFAWTCFGLSSFAYSKKWIKESVSNFQGGTINKEYYLQVIRNLRPSETPGFVEEQKLAFAPW